MRKIFPTRSVRVAAALAVALGAAGTASAVALSSSSAQADPAWTTSYVGVGADVTQDFYAALSGASPAPGLGNTTYYVPIHSSVATNSKTISSFDANPAGGLTTAPQSIATKTGGPSFDRPNSTTAGLAALLDAATGALWQNSSGSVTPPTSVTGQIDFARAARGVKIAGSTLTFIPYGRDALGILEFDHGTGNLATLTTAELNSLYSSSTGQITINGDTVDACLTISGSTPRSNLESAVGVSDNQANTAATAAGCNNLVQNSGDAFYSFASTLPAGTDAVVPISSASWIGQDNGLGVDRSSTARAGGAKLAAIDSLGSPILGTSPNETPNPNYYASTQYGYNVYTVVPTNKVTGAFADHALQSLFVGSTSAMCSSSAQATANSFGFASFTGALSTLGTCGSTTTQGNG